MERCVCAALKLGSLFHYIEGFYCDPGVSVSAALEKRERTRLLSSKGHLKDFLLLFGLTSKKCTFERDTNQLLPGCLGLSQVGRGLKHWGFCQFDFSSILQCALSSVLVGTGTGCPQPQLGIQQLVPRQRALPKGSPSLPSSLPSCGNVTSLGLWCPFVS